MARKFALPLRAIPMLGTIPLILLGLRGSSWANLGQWWTWLIVGALSGAWGIIAPLMPDDWDWRDLSATRTAFAEVLKHPFFPVTYCAAPVSAIILTGTALSLQALEWSWLSRIICCALTAVILYSVLEKKTIDVLQDADIGTKED
eukprot:TRINITY_DN6613_c0_g1_i2.p1 TRINITY_DN6613_c0_g1~~TRINITY_DN6613_c0_g1_i2.p1  ORF type:complete len:146 (+),score=16.88 TRINITY_DN6613_c0_g1_i2:60-497(+)